VPAITAESLAGWLQFKGVVSNPRNRRRVAIISIRGKDYLVKVNDQIDGVRIERIEKSGLLVAYQGTSVELAPRSVPLALGN
jgi:type II secretory pathway component PulC